MTLGTLPWKATAWQERKGSPCNGAKRMTRSGESCQMERSCHLQLHKKGKSDVPSS